MPTLPASFEPSKESMYKWFGTRKKPLVFGAVELPGVFQTHAYSTDTIRICIVFILELIGAFAIMYEGGFSLYSTIPIIFAIIVDVFLAIQLHSYVPKRLENKNQAKATDDPVLAQRYEELTKSGKWTETILKFFIILIGAIKGIGYLLLVGSFDPQVFLLFIIFIIIALLHITTTGFWFAEFNLRNGIKSEVKQNIMSLGKEHSAKKRVSKFKSEVKVNPINIGQHSLAAGENDEYVITTVGVLTDNHLASMVAAQPNAYLQTVVASACIKHQIQNILLG